MRNSQVGQQYWKQALGSSPPQWRTKVFLALAVVMPEIEELQLGLLSLRTAGKDWAILVRFMENALHRTSQLRPTALNVAEAQHYFEFETASETFKEQPCRLSFDCISNIQTTLSALPLSFLLSTFLSVLCVCVLHFHQFAWTLGSCFCCAE